jgi:hypothetical protein
LIIRWPLVPVKDNVRKEDLAMNTTREGKTTGTRRHLS